MDWPESIRQLPLREKARGTGPFGVDLSESESGKCSPLLEPGCWAANPATVARPRSRSQRQRHLSPEEQLEVVHQYQAGNTINAVAREFKLHRTTVTAILERHDVKVRLRRMSEEHVSAAVKMYAAGHSLADVGSSLGFDPTTLASHLRDQGLRIRSAHERPARVKQESSNRE